MKKRFFLVVFLVVSFRAISSEIDSTYESFVQNTTNRSDVKSFNNRLESNFFKEKGKFVFNVGMEIMHDFIDENDVDGEFNLNSAYIIHTPTDNLEFTAGRKIITWGKADEFNPADFLAPEDLRYFIFKEKGERVLANNIIQAKLNFGDSSITGVMVPLQRTGKLPGSDSIWRTADMRILETTPGVVIHDKKMEETPFKSNQYAIKFSSDFSVMDIDLIYFSGFHLIPEYVKSLSGTTVNIHEDYRRFNGYGLGVSGAYKSYTFRFEGAFKDRISLLVNAAATNIDRAMFQINTGVDWTDGENIHVSVQYVLSEIMKYKEGITARKLSDFLFLQYKTSFFDENMEVRLRVGNAVMSDDGTVFNFEGNYTFFENYVVTLGAYVFGGTNNRGLFSQYDKNDLVYAKFKILF